MDYTNSIHLRMPVPARIYLTAFALLLWTDGALAQKRIACVGNSITAGTVSYGSEEHRYPTILRSYLDTNYIVDNFGSPSTCAIKKSDVPYWDDIMFLRVFEYEPDIITIMLGTNDSKDQNWQYKDDFLTDLEALLDTFSTIPTAPALWICLPPPKFEHFLNQEIKGEVIHEEIVPFCREAAQNRGIPVIDTHTPLLPHEDYFPDAVHPNHDGASILAAIIAEAIRTDAPLRYRPQSYAGGQFGAYPRPVVSVNGAFSWDGAGMGTAATLYSVQGRRLGSAERHGRHGILPSTALGGMAVLIADPR